MMNRWTRLKLLDLLKRFEKKGLQFTRFEFTHYINRNGLDKLAENRDCKYRGKERDFYSTWPQALQEQDNEGTASEGHSHRVTTKNEEHCKVQRRIRKKFGNIIERRREQGINIIV